MYLLILKDGHDTRYIGPYSTTSQASEDLQRVLSSCSNRASWQIHALEVVKRKSFATNSTTFNQEHCLYKAS
ncbi:hypothetical protein [Prochlorococcus marinus]|uniref:hypothetical protein n=1 Tax=Prochlorococcus marinus TaxID=1219 RepID=UPI0000672852|nr:hypothetical protein [Prochlorococcus marinus]